jgi:hypothetical protein
MRIYNAGLLNSSWAFEFIKLLISMKALLTLAARHQIEAGVPLDIAGLRIVQLFIYQRSAESETQAATLLHSSSCHF